MSATLSSSPRSPIKNQNGQSLVQLLVSIGIMGILISGFASMQVSQQRQITQLSQKLATLDIQRSLTATLADPTNVCTYMANNPVFPAFNPMDVGTASLPLFNFTQIPSKGVAGAPPAVSVSTTIPASPLSNSLFVSSIQLTDLKCIPSLCTPTTTQFSANITVAFDSSKLVIGLAPLKFPTTLTTTGAANSQTISSCQGGGGGFQSCTTVTVSSVAASISATCAVGDTLTGGGCSGSGMFIGALGGSYPSGTSWVCNYWGFDTTMDPTGSGVYDRPVVTGNSGFGAAWTAAVAHAICCH